MTPLIIKPPRRSFHLVLAEVIHALGGYKIVAQALFVAPVTVSKWMEDPEVSGQWIPVKHLQELFAEVGQHLANHAAQMALEELLSDHLLNLCHRRSYPTDKVFEFVEMLTGQNGKAA